ncbi:hypothetical protein ACFPZN_43895 [Actinomadura rugatobispora]|uniref:Transposase n=1 Tax=Actinomadura rugatobispora TaxID=1994 RepID=A0ABW1ADJ2_9ACTN|nr:hypothetical protein GCM10010200_075910 [Actinomadura rugatobispora]
MGDGTNCEDRELAGLRAEFTGHRIWRSVRFDGRLGDWVATLHDPGAGVDPTVICSTADELHAALKGERTRAQVKVWTR